MYELKYDCFQKTIQVNSLKDNELEELIKPWIFRNEESLKGTPSSKK